ncbi:MAG: cobyrinic acid a,c-diamide synthase [Pelagibacterium sp.]|uniref:cobyrinate a,c-diamide synthase n=1 Tax=uncultured Pelagibacterium sp. TaxID=1159875 RepID=UPI000C696E82|nr:cobyrinic acid a,c-diamide synthase [Pelagibacterium sp.]
MTDPSPRGFIIAAPRSGSGKTAVTLGIARALTNAGYRVAPAKTGPDYIDPAFLSRAAQADAGEVETGSPFAAATQKSTAAINLDPWAMDAKTLTARAAQHAERHDILLIEGVMGLFDSAIDGKGSTADLAATLDLPVILVVDCDRQAQSVAALVHGFASWRNDVTIAGIILNKVASDRHETMLRDALAKTAIPCLGAIPRRADLALPERHLGLVLPGDIEGIEDHLARAGSIMTTHLNFRLLGAIAAPVAPAAQIASLAPLGQRIAIAHDAAFAFIYPHLLESWHNASASLNFFSPLANEAPDADADAVFLPGGYPELHGATLANASSFKSGLINARDRGALIYGECGGYMVLGQTLTDKSGATYPMAGLLPVSTAIDRPRRVLGYRRLTHASPLPWPEKLCAHEFHYSQQYFPNVEQSGVTERSTPYLLAPLFGAVDALGTALDPMGCVLENVMGSYAHIIEGAAQ